MPYPGERLAGEEGEVSAVGGEENHDELSSRRVEDAGLLLASRLLASVRRDLVGAAASRPDRPQLAGEFPKRS